MKHNRNIAKIITTLSLLLLIISIDSISKFFNSERKISERINQGVKEAEYISDSIRQKFFSSTDKQNSFINDISSNKENNAGIYIFLNDSLIYWNSDQNDPFTLLSDTKENLNIIQQGNNTYFTTFTQSDSLKLFTSTLLCQKIPQAGDYDKFALKNINGNYTIDFFIENDEVIFNLNYQPSMNKIYSYIIGILLITLLLKLFNYTFSILNKRKGLFLLFPIISLVILIFINFLQNNLFLSTSKLFGNSCLKNNLNISLGLLSEISCWLLYNITCLSSKIPDKEKKTKGKLLLISTVTYTILLIYTYIILYLLSNTNIYFHFLQIYKTTAESYVFLIIIGIITCSVIILLKNLLSKNISKNSRFINALTSSICVSFIANIIAIQFIEIKCVIFICLATIVFVLISLWKKKSDIKYKSIISNIVIITLMSIQLTYILYYINEKKEKEEMEWFATVVGDESDEVFEQKIMEITQKIKTDDKITEWHNDNNYPSDDSLLNYLNKKYFNTEEIVGYNKALTLCDSTTILIIEGQENYETNCVSLFDYIINYNYSEAVSEELSLIDDPTTDSYYILKIELSPAGSSQGKICFIEFYKEYILNYIGLPELITSHENVIMPNLVNYSFSSYEDDILQYKFGHFDYPKELNNFRFKDEKYVKTKIFKHLTKKFNNHKTIIVTIEKPRLIDIIAPFSYIFIVLSIILYLNNGSRKKDRNQIKRSLHLKMQLTIILTLGFSFLVAGFTSFIFIKNSLSKKDSIIRFERNKSIVKNLEKDYFENRIENEEDLKKYKENYFTDINIYDTNGYIINTTQPKLFNGFKSRIINRKAYESLILRERFYYSCTENINGTDYISSYYPLRDKTGKIHAIINIPYFENKTISKSSMSNFIIAYINVIFVLMGISALIVILMTRSLIKPFKIIQDKMQKISLEDKNETIEWKSNDEIGDLIKIYNKLIKELEISANKLMRSERETAWREMARQVAHEIKNPLTPMKLNIQFLQMAWDEKNPDIDRKMRETTKSILEQIDSLSNIATAFSNYAKLPKTEIEYFNLKELISNCINLYSNNENIEIRLEAEDSRNYNINSDRNNLKIVFNNIIKNAIQAIGKKENGLIKVSIKELSSRYLIEIRDNGCGIDEEVKKKIFMPNFTTKSSGMGVGLSIVYNIIESLNGSINFESEVGEGTTFFIEIRQHL